MKITKINGVRFTSKDVGRLYRTDGQELDLLHQYVENRIATANKNTLSMYSVFKKSKQPKPWQSKVNKFILSKEQTFTDKVSEIKDDMLKKSLKDQFLPFIQTILDFVAQGKGATSKEKLQKLEELRAAAKKDKDRILRGRCAQKIAKSIERQVSPFCIKNGEVSFIETSDKCHWERMLGIGKEDKPDKNLSSLFEMLDNHLFVKSDCEISKDGTQAIDSGTFKEIQPILKRNNQKIRKEDRSNGYDTFWANRAYSAFIAEYGGRENSTKILKMDEVKRRVKGKVKAGVTSKILQLGKILCHFTDDEGGILATDYTISGFDMEMIKAKETLSEKVNTAILYAISNLALATGKMEQQEDFMLEKAMEGTTQTQRRFATFFGGNEFFTSRYKGVQEDGKELDFAGALKETRALLYALRNSHFHYAQSLQSSDATSIKYDNIKMLYDRECKLQGEFILRKYQSNGLDLYFDEQELIELILKIHNGKTEVQSVFIPSFRRVLKALKDRQEMEIEQEEARYTAQTFLLRQIYYNCFLQEKTYDHMCLDIKDVAPSQAERTGKDKAETAQHQKAYEDFKAQFSKYKDVATLSLQLQREVMQANAKNHSGVRHKYNYETLLRRVLAAGFIKYVKKHFAKELNLLKAERKDVQCTKLQCSQPIGLEENYLQLMDSDAELLLGYYIMAKFLPSKQLNELMGDFKKYKQYIQDIQYRAKNVEKTPPLLVERITQELPISLCDRLIKVLSLCSEGNGQIIGGWEDYYQGDDTHTPQDEYAKIIGDFLQGNVTTFEELKIWQEKNLPKKAGEPVVKYADEQNPIIFAQIERGRQNGTFDIIKSIYNLKIDGEILKKIADTQREPCYNKFNDVKALTPMEQKKKAEYNFLQNQVELYTVQMLEDILIELYTTLVCWCYMWERDLEYASLGICYLLEGQPTVKKVKSIFIYDPSTNKSLSEKLREEKDKSQKYGELLESLILENKKLGKNDFRMKVRNQIAHWEYFRTDYRQHSLLEYYNYFYSMFSYSPRLRNSVFPKLISILEHFHIQQGYENGKQKKLLKFNTPTKGEWGKEKQWKELYQRATLNTGVLEAKKIESAGIPVYELIVTKPGIELKGKMLKAKIPLFDEQLIPIIEELLQLKQAK
ncbi:MAG: type VI-A CRISPR-associated RNA-guided ribonuclease Cas13a [Oscillospiraceae bacterium]